MKGRCYHDSRDAGSRFPFGAVHCGAEVKLRLYTGRSMGRIRVQLRQWSAALGEKICDPNVITEMDDRYCHEYAVLALEEPGLMWYHFVLNQADGISWYGAPPDGLGGEGLETVSLPADWQITVYDSKAKVPSWYTHGIMYQIFPDRFYRGDTPKLLPALPPGGLYHPHWEDNPFYAKDPQTGDIAAYDFFGGTLQGIIEKLAYLKSMGISMIYLNPIFQSVSNHKYDTGDYKKVDEQFGGDDAFEKLQLAAREAGIRIILDGVFSHTGVDSPYFQAAVRSPEAPTYPWYRFTEYPEKYDCWWGVTTLPNVNEMEPSFREFIISNKDSVIKHWLKRGASGWRLDVADELPGEFVQEMFRELKQTDPEAVLIGEVWEDASHKVSYGVMRQYLWGNELDSVINYPWRKLILEYLLGQTDASGAMRQWESLCENYPVPYFYSTMNVLGTHDVPRILTLLAESVPEASLTKLEQARYRLPAKLRAKAIARLKLAALIQFTSPGVPCIYYGDEAGIEGYGDPHNRRTYPWGMEETELVGWYRQLGKLREEEQVLRTGRWIPLSAGPEILAFGRRTDNGKDVFGELVTEASMLVLVNRGADAFECCVDVTAVCSGPMLELFPEPGGQIVPAQDGTINVSLAPFTAKIFKASVHPLFSFRQSGVLLHPTSLSGPFGIGDIGPGALAFVDWLAEAGQSLWQILPLTPVDFTGSPYQSASAFAGNPLLISPAALLEQQLLMEEELPAPQSDEKTAVRIDFDAVAVVKKGLLKLAFERFSQQEEPEEYQCFCREAADWLEDYALFSALKDFHGGLVWTGWETGAARRNKKALQRYREQLATQINYYRFEQYIFQQQWARLHQHAASQGIKIVGDLPIFVSHDSADVWAQPRLFSLDTRGRTKTRAGVPPDYFSATGQLWGNPHYNWRAHDAEDFAWWVRRLKWLFRLVDAVRIDHFRGFEAFWEIPARAKTAVRGRWVKGPGESFFNALWRQLGAVPIIAEDLGVITPEVVKLKESFFMPGMVILQFEIWPEPDNDGIHLPAPQPNSFYYTGTHDNDTLLGWLKSVRSNQPELFVGAAAYAKRKPNASPAKLVRPLISRVLQSDANTVIVPVQDWLGLDTGARMNLPSTCSGNWGWRLSGRELTAELAAEVRALSESARRSRE